MKKIAIVGAGQAGLQLAIGLVKQKKYQVTVFSDRSAEDIAAGKIMSSQVMFNTALQYEKNLGLDFWDSSYSNNCSITFTLSENANQLIHWKSMFAKPFMSIDQRLKFPKWMQEFEKLGGNLIIKKIDIEDLEAISKVNDLTIISTGKKEISGIFERDIAKSFYTQPQRSLMCLYVNNTFPAKKYPGIKVNILPKFGEIFIATGLTLSGPCEMMLFEAIPGSEFDCWQQTDSARTCLTKAISLLNKFLPWEAQRCEYAKLTDDNAMLIGKYTPEIRHPIAELPTKSLVFGMGDTIVLNDPIAGQGANNASKCAQVYLESILSNQDNVFDETWMQATFDKFWDDAQWSTKLSNMFLEEPDEQAMDIIKRAETDSYYANHLANAFEDPKEFFSWLSKSNKF